MLLCGKAFCSVPVIPVPAGYTVAEGTMNAAAMRVTYKGELATEAAYLGSKLAQTAKPAAGAAAKTVKIHLKTGLRNAAPGSYTLKVTPQGATVTGADAAGVFYGAVTLSQMAAATGGLIACGTVTDSPRYQWRGFMLDEARHFSGEQKVMQILDLMAYFKLNRFHWHLTDSEGWRIEIKGYPRLSQVGGQGNWSRPQSTVAQYYTQEQIRRIVAYAAERHIEVIPEIDMPGHANAANKAYPELSGGKGVQNPDFTFNPGKESTYAVLSAVLREVAGLFPSKYMNMGGDEVSFGIDAWGEDPDVQALIKRESLSGVKDAENYFINRISDTIRAIGKQPVGWEEILAANPDKKTVVLWWRQNKPEELMRSLSGGYPTVLCPRLPCYLDFIQDKRDRWGRVWVEAYNRLQDVYAFPDALLTPMAVADTLRTHIIGIQANVWRERMHDLKRLDYMMWPRLCALAESAWSVPGNKDFGDFSRRMDNVYTLFDSLGIYYYDHRDPSRHPEAQGREKNENQEGKPADFID